MLIAPDVHAVRLRGANAFLIAEPRLALIDAGLPGSRPAVERYVARIGRSLDELDLIICTHGHPDHVGGAAELAAVGAEVFMHPADAERSDSTLATSSARRLVRASSLPSPVPRRRSGHWSMARCCRSCGGLEVVAYPGPHAGQRLPLRGA